MSLYDGALVFLKVSPMKGVMRFGKKGKLASRYIGPFEIRLKVGEVAYATRVVTDSSSVSRVNAEEVYI